MKKKLAKMYKKENYADDYYWNFYCTMQITFRQMLNKNKNMKYVFKTNFIKQEIFI